jgi:hypothetical protein
LVFPVGKTNPCREKTRRNDAFMFQVGILQGKDVSPLGLFDKIMQSMGRPAPTCRAASISWWIPPVIDEAFYEDLTDILIMATPASRPARPIIARLRERCKAEGIRTTAPAREALKEIVADMMGSEPMRLASPMGRAGDRRQRRVARPPPSESSPPA